MEKLKALSRGTKLVVVAGPVLFVSLFFNWQTLHIDYGPSGIADQPQDGWDAFGLLIGLLTIATVTLVVLRRLTEVAMSEDVSWETVTLGLGVATFLLAILKNVTDANSTWASYGFVLVAGLLALGTYLNRAETHASSTSLLGRKRGGFSSVA